MFSAAKRSEIGTENVIKHGGCGDSPESWCRIPQGLQLGNLMSRGVCVIREVEDAACQVFSVEVPSICSWEF